MYSKTVIVGRLTRDMEQKEFGESLLTSFSVAVDDGFGDKKTTDFYNVSAWNGVGKGVAPYLTKGTIVLVEGKMKSRKNESTTFWDLRADQIRLVGGNTGGNTGGTQTANRNNNGYQQNQNQNQYHATHTDPYFVPDISGDDLPF